jgi:UDP-N-acetyl-alpha-D-muramoyl-L-alanyl-L-glutamate epimerase
MNKFIFKGYEFNATTRTASFRYGFEDGTEFEESVQFSRAGEYDKELLDRALFLSFMLVGTSYYKAFPSREVVLERGGLDEWQVTFFNSVYQEGLSQFAFENKLTRDDLVHFAASMTTGTVAPLKVTGKGVLSLQSGGKDSLLTATLLDEKHTPFTSWYIGSSSHYPMVLEMIGQPVVTAERFIDIEALKAAREKGGLNGHVPITYIVTSFALIDAVLSGARTVLLSIGHEGEEAHDWIGDLPVNHQWSKTWPAEQAFAEYVHRYISPDLQVGSPLRGFTELKIAELFATHAWERYGYEFSSCNIANYMQGNDNTELKWCGHCPKCANSFLLFAPFLPAAELKSLFGGQDLFEKPILQETFKGLLGVDGVMKPFECVGETAELRLAYHKAQAKGGYGTLSFDVPESTFDYEQEYDAQGWARQMIQ